MQDPGYIASLKINHPELNTSGSVTLSDTSSEKLSLTSSSNKALESDILSEVLVLPEPRKAGRRGVNSKAVCVTELEFIGDIKSKEEKKKADEELKFERKKERESKRAEREKLEAQQKEKKRNRAKWKN